MSLIVNHFGSSAVDTEAGNIGGHTVMSAVQQRVLLLRHYLEEEGVRDCIFRREWAYSLNKQRQACVCYDYCDRAIFMLPERGREGFFFLGQALCK